MSWTRYSFGRLLIRVSCCPPQVRGGKAGTPQWHSRDSVSLLLKPGRGWGLEPVLWGSDEEGVPPAARRWRGGEKNFAALEKTEPSSGTFCQVGRAAVAVPRGVQGTLNPCPQLCPWRLTALGSALVPASGKVPQEVEGQEERVGCMAAGLPSVSFSELPRGTRAATRAEDSDSLAGFWCGTSLCPPGRAKRPNATASWGSLPQGVLSPPPE